MSPNAVAYYLDGISAEFDDVYGAAQQVLIDTGGIDEDKKEDGFLKGKWIEDKVKRNRERFLIGKTQKDYQRRTRISYHIRPLDNYVEVSVSADFQFKPADAAMAAPWRSLKPSREDLEQEKIFFKKLLQTLARRKTASQ